jgi:hypothetical protein
MDVTPLVQSVTSRLGTVSMGGNVATIVVQNPNHVLSISESNLAGKYTLGKGTISYDTAPAADVGFLEYDEGIKKRILTSKQDIQKISMSDGKTMRQVVLDAFNKTRAQQTRYYNKMLFFAFPEEGSEFATRWDLALGTSIFNVNDPVRVFYKHPYRSVAGTDGSYAPEWYYGFTGYITSVSENEDLGNGVFTFTLSCEGAANRLLRLARVARNPSVYLDSIAATNDLLVGDIINLTGATSVFRDLTMPQVLGVLVAGATPQVKALGSAVPFQSESLSNVRGIGRFSLGFVQEYYTGCLSSWQDLIHPVLTIEEVTQVGINSGFGPLGTENSGFGGFSGASAPDTGALHILLPDQKDALDNYNRLINYAVSDPSWQSEFETRLDIIKKYIVDNLLYSVFESPKGDVVAEFPMFDFTPYDFGDYGKQNLIHNSSSTNVTLSEDDSKAYTWIVVSGGFAPVDIGADQEIIQAARTAHAVLTDLLPRYGIRVLNVNNPLLRSDEALKYFTKVLAAKTVADVRSARADLGLMDPTILPNRPYLLSYKSLLGYLLTVQNSTVFQSGAQTGIDLNYIRMFTKDTQGNYKFWLLGGEDSSSKPLMFRNLTNDTYETSPPEKSKNVIAIPGTGTVQGPVSAQTSSSTQPVSQPPASDKNVGTVTGPVIQPSTPSPSDTEGIADAKAALWALMHGSNPWGSGP